MIGPTTSSPCRCWRPGATGTDPYWITPAAPGVDTRIPAPAESPGSLAEPRWPGGGSGRLPRRRRGPGHPRVRSPDATGQPSGALRVQAGSAESANWPADLLTCNGLITPRDPLRQDLYGVSALRISTTRLDRGQMPHSTGTVSRLSHPAAGQFQISPGAWRFSSVPHCPVCPWAISRHISCAGAATGLAVVGV